MLLLERRVLLQLRRATVQAALLSLKTAAKRIHAQPIPPLLHQ